MFKKIAVLFLVLATVFFLAARNPGSWDTIRRMNLGQFAATTSAQLLAVLSDETGTGLAVFGTSPTITNDETISGATPRYIFKDTDAQADGDDNASIDINCAGTCTTGAEDIDVTFKAQRAGTDTNYIFFNADSTVALDDSIDAYVEIGTAAAPVMPRLYSATYTSAETLEAEESYNSTIYISNATTVTLSAIAYGMKVTVITITAHAISLDTNASDKIILDGTALNDGDKATSGSTAGEVIVCTYYSTDGWYCASDGWTDGGA